MSARENECQISQNYILHMKCSKFYLCFHNSCEIWPSCSRATVRNFLWCYYRWLITCLALKKFSKECNMLWIILLQAFCSLQIKITRFPGGLRHNYIPWISSWAIALPIFNSQKMGCIQAKASLIGQHDCHLAVSYFNPCVLEYCFSVSVVFVTGYFSVKSL